MPTGGSANHKCHCLNRAPLRRAAPVDKQPEQLHTPQQHADENASRGLGTQAPNTTRARAEKQHWHAPAALIPTATTSPPPCGLTRGEPIKDPIWFSELRSTHYFLAFCHVWLTPLPSCARAFLTATVQLTLHAQSSIGRPQPPLTGSLSLAARDSFPMLAGRCTLTEVESSHMTTCPLPPALNFLATPNCNLP
jgi:hypothetical protein